MRRTSGAHLSNRRLGPCESAPVIQVLPEAVVYGPMVPSALEEWVQGRLHGGATDQAPVPKVAVEAEPRL